MKTKNVFDRCTLIEMADACARFAIVISFRCCRNIILAWFHKKKTEDEAEKRIFSEDRLEDRG